jgi:hypothetical protein
MRERKETSKTFKRTFRTVSRNHTIHTTFATPFPIRVFAQSHDAAHYRNKNFAKAREKKKKAIERIDANARDATKRRFRAQPETMREYKQNAWN